MKNILYISLLAFVFNNSWAQITIVSKTHSAFEQLSADPLNTMFNGGFEIFPSDSPDILESPGSSVAWHSVWSSGCSIPGWTSNSSPSAYGAIGPIRPNGTFANMSSERNCSITQYADGTSPAAALSNVNVGAAPEGSNLLYMGLGSAWVTAAADPSFDPGTGEIWPQNSDPNIIIGTTPNSITQAVAVENGESYLLEFYLTGEGNDPDGFVKVDISDQTLWITVPGERFDNFDTNYRYFQICFTASSTGNIDITFTSYGHITNSNLNSPAWNAWFNGVNSAAEAFLDDIEFVNKPPLPIVLSEFHLHQKQNSIELSWTTESEINNDYFIVEHSVDGHHWSRLGRIEGMGTTNQRQQYSFEHISPSNGYNYYRLKQIDFDGKFEYSESRSIQLSDYVGLEIFAFPNPVEELLTIKTNQEDFERSSIILFDTHGQNVTNKTVIHSVGAGKIQIEMASLEVGLYILRIGGQSKLIFKK